jgi:hypothetical protein
MNCLDIHKDALGDGVWERRTTTPTPLRAISDRVSGCQQEHGRMTFLWISPAFHKRDKFALTQGRYAWKCTSADLVFGYINLHFTFF